MTRGGRLAIAAAVAAAAAAAAAATFGDRGAPPLPDHTPLAVVQAPAAETARPAVGRVLPAASKPDQKQVDRSRELELPDGTFVAALNGAVDATSLATYWGTTPWSPIVGVERSSAGVDWYRHADGSYSTTEMVWRKDLGRKAAMTRVAHPGPSAPVAPVPNAR